MATTDYNSAIDAATLRERRLTHALTLVILLLAIALRFTGLNWDLGQWIHPDEGHMRMITGAVRWPGDLSVYFDTQVSPLNPRNHDQVYSYGTLPLFMTRAVTEWLDRACENPAARVPSLVAASVLKRLSRSGFTPPPGRLCHPGTFTWTYSAFVGRHLAALADVGTVVVIGLLGWRLYGRRAGLLAMALAAGTAFLIQQAHFYTVDSAATFFTALTAAFAIRAGQAPTERPPWLWLGLGGVATGLAAACKVSAALAAGLVALGALQWLRCHMVAVHAIASLRAAGQDEVTDRGHRWALSVAVLQIAGSVALSATLAFAAFRVGQPYAFEGPDLLGLEPNTAWFDRLTQIREEQSGTVDYPSGRQWAARLPLVFPLRNLGLWGLGLPLGLAAGAGWAIAGWQLARGDHRHLVLWLWTTAYTVFYATRWVKAMRYFLPVYPLLILLAAYALECSLAAGLRKRRARALASSKHATGAEAVASAGAGGWLALAVPGTVVLTTVLWGLALFGIYLRPHTRVAASRWIYASVPDGSVVANEHWDWGLPLRIDGRDAFREGGANPTFSQVTLELYNEDTPEKREQLLAWLDEVDYIFLASNRLYGSISRLPDRYPLTNAYYRALFAGELGFELDARFTSYMQLGPFVFPDQENPFPLMAAAYATQDHLLAVSLPPAEESFSVYDHPDCLIFRKTEAYTHDNAQALLGAVDLTQAAPWQSPQEATPQVVQAAHSILFYGGLGLTAIVGAAALLRRAD